MHKRLIMKNIFLLLITFTVLLQAQTLRPKTGCILAQVGNVEAYWINKEFKGVFSSVNYHPVAKEGINFKEILVGSSLEIEANSIATKISAKILNIQADKRIKTKPRTGTIDIELTINHIKKTITLIYSYHKEVMKALGVIHLADFRIEANKNNAEIEIGFTMHIKAILCAIAHKK